MTLPGTPSGETVPGEQVSNDAPTAPIQTPAPATPAAPTADEVAELRKKAEQAEMRARQLENEKQAREKADEEARQKQLEEQNEFKTLYEREKQAREDLERERQEAETRDTLNNATSAIFAGYDPAVVEVAQTAGLALFDDSDEAKADLTQRLDAIAAKVAPAKTPPKVPGNNPTLTPPSSDAAERRKLLNRMRYDDRSVSDGAKREVISKIPALNEMRKIAGVAPKEQ